MGILFHPLFLTLCADAVREIVYETECNGRQRQAELLGVCNRSFFARNPSKPCMIQGGLRGVDFRCYMVLGMPEAVVGENVGKNQLFFSFRTLRRLFKVWRVKPRRDAATPWLPLASFIASSINSSSTSRTLGKRPPDSINQLFKR